MSNGRGGVNRARYTQWSLYSLNNEIILVLKKLQRQRYNGAGLFYE